MSSKNSETCQVIAAVIKRTSTFLICQRPPDKRHGSLWEFPGGKVENGENLFEAAQRELKEELGVEVISVGAVELAVSDPGSPFVVNFAIVDIEGEPQALEHSELRWLTADELIEMPLAPSDRTFVLHLNQQTTEQ